MAKIIRFPLKERRRERPAQSAAPAYALGLPEWVVEVEQKVEQFDQAVALFL
jgi:hypothetical protein